MKNIIESQVEPKDTNVLWLDTSNDIKQLKTFINGKWQVVNDDTKNNEQIVDTVLKKIDTDFSQTVKKTDIDAILKSNSNNPIANSAVTNNFVKRINKYTLSSDGCADFFLELNEYISNARSIQIPIILSFNYIYTTDTNEKIDTSEYLFFVNMQDFRPNTLTATGIYCGSETNYGNYKLQIYFSEIRLIRQNSSMQFTSYTITTELQNDGTFNGAFNSNEFKKQLLEVTKFDVYNHELNIAKDLTIIVKAGNSTIYYKGVIWYVQGDDYSGYKYYGEEFDANSNSENIDKPVIKFDFFDGEVTNFTYNESTTISNLIQNTNALKTNLSTLSSKHTTDINTLTTKLNTKMTVYNGGVYQEDSGSKLALVNELKNTVTFDEDGVGVCTINFNNSIFGGSKIDNANLVAKVYNVTADNLIEIKGTVTGKYTISGQPKGTESGDTIGTDDISYIKHYDFDLKWNTSTNKEILYICKELNVQADLLDTLSYGVRWNSNKSSSPVCQRIGNLQMHRELPIQNGMKGCIVKYSADKKPEIQYYLDENDWRFRKDPIILKNVDLTSNEDESTEYLINDVFKTLQYKNQYIKVIIDDVKSIYKITDIDTETGKATIVSESEISTQAPPIGGSRDIELGSCLNGYDGEVMVEVPEFYIRSWEKENGDKEVRISQYKIDDTWEKQPHCLISPYCVTLLREVPENMGYLSTLPASTAISVCNTETYCRGGNNGTAYDKYLITDPFRTNLGKPGTKVAKATMRTYCRKSKDKEIMSYNQHKRILYWLYVIEYANFNCQSSYNSKLDSNGFKQGGLGNGVTTLDLEWIYYNKYNPLTPNGYTNEFGNTTNIKEMRITFSKDMENTSTVTRTMNVPRWHGIENPFGDIHKNVDGIIINSSSINKDGVKYSEVYTTDDTTLYSDSDYESMKKVGIELNKDGYIKEFNIGTTAEIIPIINNANYNTYKCDYHDTNSSVGLCELFLSGAAYHSGSAGLGFFFSYSGVGNYYSDVGFRSSSNLE